MGFIKWVFKPPAKISSKKMIQVLVLEPSRMNGAMVPVSPAENVKMTLKSGKVPEDLRQSKSGSLFYVNRGES